jgi:hypothetical protein
MERRECPSCHSANLINGNFGGESDKFIPDDRFMWIGYTPRGFVCLDCGFLAHYLDSNDIQDIRKKLKS